MIFRVLYDRDPHFWVDDSVESVDASKFIEVAQVEGDSLDDIFCKMNVVDGTELPVKLHVRSMSVGDVLIDAEGLASICCSLGWKRIVVK
jgi:hypothetical protein